MNKALFERIVVAGNEWLQRYPWALAVFGFFSGLASFFLVERNDELAQVLTLLMLGSWAWLALENMLKKGVWHWFGIKVPRPVLRFVNQLVHQETLFFVIPFFVFTTAWNSGQLLFTSLLVAAAAVSIIDPLYYGWLARKRWLYFLFHGVTLFAMLLTALPIVFNLPTSASYPWALGIAMVVALPSLARSMPLEWRRQTGSAVLLVVLTGAVGWWARAWVPPASLWLTEVAITDRLDDSSREPDRRLTRIDESQLRAGLYAYTAIRAPRGLHERIYHVWYHNGKEIDRIALEITGGREEGYRAWTHKENFPESLAGQWNIRVITSAEQLIGVLRFSVSEVPGGKPVARVSEASELEPGQRFL